MALPGHSPPPPPPPTTFVGPGSPPRSLNGYNDLHAPYPIYGPQPRPMPPPSPQHFPSRFSQTHVPPPPATANNYQNDSRAPQPPQKRPGSSMSILSMLGSEPEKPQQELIYNQSSRAPPRPQSTNGSSTSFGTAMSPPQYPPRPLVSDYSYKPRSRTPDRLSEPMGTRPFRSSSGSLMQRPGSFYDRKDNANTEHPARLGGPVSSTAATAYSPRREDAAERARRTSLSGILQRPESQPARPLSGQFIQNPSSLSRPEYPAPSPADGDILGLSKTALLAELVGRPGSYDTRPPAFSSLGRTAADAPKDDPKPAAARESLSRSPDLRRANPSTTEHRSLPSILSNIPDQRVSQNMVRQDSIQSQSDRSVFGDRYKPRAFSPFAGSVASQTMSNTSIPADDLMRKGSDELSQHRAVLSVAAEAKRGRYSPVPQAVQGAQAQTPVPDAGLKDGRVFAGLGGGLGSSSTASASHPAGLSASPFKQNEAAARLSEENLMKISRSSSGINKRPRKYDEDVRAESDLGDGKKSGSRKKSKYAHSYKLGIERDGTTRRSTPLGINGLRRTATPTNTATSAQQLHHHHQLQRQATVAEQMPLFKPKKIIKITSLISLASRSPRRHLGSFVYDPEITNSDTPRQGFEKFDISIKPNLLLSFTEAEQNNCTYTLRVPKLWLQERERSLICKQAYLFGSGIYTDDSDIVAAAMHSGYIQSAAPENVDKVLLGRVIREQNAKIEGLIDLPDKPAEPEPGKDAIITVLVLPALDRYISSSRFGISSRAWPEGSSKTPHDGVSFTVLKVEFVSSGIEGRRMGRTGKQKRARLHRELDERSQIRCLQKQMLDKVKRRLKEQKKVKGKGPHPLSMVSQPGDMTGTGKEKGKGGGVALDIGHAPGEWLRQLEVPAVE